MGLMAVVWNPLPAKCRLLKLNWCDDDPLPTTQSMGGGLWRFYKGFYGCPRTRGSGILSQLPFTWELI